MGAEILRIVSFIGQSFLHIWPYLLITIPVAVVVGLTDGSKYIGRAFNRKPILAIIFATLVGAISPFCSCGVIPIVASLLIGGVPLAPVMSFWIASPSMDPEMFFLSVSTLGWELAVWRLAATFAISLGAGLATHYLAKRGWFGDYVLIGRQKTNTIGLVPVLKRIWISIHQLVRPAGVPVAVTPDISPYACCSKNSEMGIPTSMVNRNGTLSSSARLLPTVVASAADTDVGSSGKPVPFRVRLFKETTTATLMVIRFMALAFLIEAIIELYVPAEWIAGLLGQSNRWAILSATLIGVPAYTSNLTALPMISGLLAQGMDRGAALAFLIAGPTTTLPAMAAVWGLVSRRVFILYVSIALVGALLIGYAYSFAQILF